MSKANEFPTMPKLEEYKGKFEQFLKLERKDGILLARMHTEDGPVQWSPFMHRQLIDAWPMIGGDLDNHVMILTATGKYWFAMHDRSQFGEWDKVHDPDLRHDGLRRPTKSVENFIYDIDIPTIGCLNGPGPSHTNFAFLCDITLCTPDFVVRDHHFNGGLVPGDSIGLLFQGLLGVKRAASLLYSINHMNAEQALECGLVNEIVPRENLIDRAQEIAQEIMKQSRPVRRMTSQIVKRPIRRMIFNDYQQHINTEMYTEVLQDTGHQIDKLRSKFTDVEKSFEEGLGKK
ncbi:enoyl-CoA hydratase/isomerase family protein [Chloroflexota bacterium]